MLVSDSQGWVHFTTRSMTTIINRFALKSSKQNIRINVHNEDRLSWRKVPWQNCRSAARCCSFSSRLGVEGHLLLYSSLWTADHVQSDARTVPWGSPADLDAITNTWILNLQSIAYWSSAIGLTCRTFTVSQAHEIHAFICQSLPVPRHNLSFGSRAFRISAPKIWNSLPPHILQSQTLSSFWRHLKTHYFQSAYPAPQHPSPMRHDSLLRFWRYNKSPTYLLIICVICHTLQSQSPTAMDKGLGMYRIAIF